MLRYVKLLQREAWRSTVSEFSLHQLLTYASAISASGQRTRVFFCPPRCCFGDHGSPRLETFLYSILSSAVRRFRERPGSIEPQRTCPCALPVVLMPSLEFTELCLLCAFGYASFSLLCASSTMGEEVHKRDRYYMDF